jgi:hypothetical protein
MEVQRPVQDLHDLSGACAQGGRAYPGAHTSIGFADTNPSNLSIVKAFSVNLSGCRPESGSDDMANWILRGETADMKCTD